MHSSPLGSMVHYSRWSNPVHSPIRSIPLRSLSTLVDRPVRQTSTLVYSSVRSTPVHGALWSIVVHGLRLQSTPEHSPVHSSGQSMVHFRSWIMSQSGPQSIVVHSSTHSSQVHSCRWYPTIHNTVYSPLHFLFNCSPLHYTFHSRRFGSTWVYSGSV